MYSSKYFSMGFKEMIPITTGVIPFGAVMGTVCAEAKLSFFQTLFMNLFLYSGTAQLASVELMSQNALAVVVITTALVINLRFLLYSAGMSPYTRQSGFWAKLVVAHTLTDQSYAVMVANKKLQTPLDSVSFYFGTSLCMFIVWHASWMAGYIFGNFAPPAWNLDFAIPLSFLALMIPSLKNKKHVLVVLFSTIVSVALYNMPLRLGLLATALLSIGFAYILTSKGRTRD